MSHPAIELTDVERTLGSFRLGPLNLRIPHGVVCGLIGANGAGKTSTLDLLMGMGRADRGHIRMLGMDPAREEVEVKRRTAYVGPDLSYQAWGRVGDALAFVSGFYPDWDHARSARLQTEFGLSSKQRINSLSFGERIKLSLLMALSREAELLLLDEPTVGLDPVSRRHLFTELLAFMQAENRTIVISSHQLNDVERFADEVILLKKGQVVVQDRMDAMTERYRQFSVTDVEQWRAIPGVEVVRTRGAEADLLLDLKTAPAELLGGLRSGIVRETTLNLEELFLLLAAVPASSSAQAQRAVA